MLSKFDKGDVVRHYLNGLLYKIIGEALDQRGVHVVVYAPMYPSEHEIFTRPVSEFEGTSSDPGSGKVVSRFVKVDPDPAEQGFVVYLHPVVRVKIPVMATSPDEALKKAVEKVWSPNSQIMYELLRAPEEECRAAGVTYSEFSELLAFSMVEDMNPADPFGEPPHTWYFDQNEKDITKDISGGGMISAKF